MHPLMSLCINCFHTIYHEQTYSGYKINKSLSLIMHALPSTEILHCLCLMHCYWSNLLEISCVRKFARLHVKQHLQWHQTHVKKVYIDARGSCPKWEYLHVFGCFYGNLLKQTGIVNLHYVFVEPGLNQKKANTNLNFGFVTWYLRQSRDD